MGNCVNNALNYYMIYIYILSYKIDNMVFYLIHIVIFVPKVVYYHGHDILIILCSVIVCIVMISS